MNSVLSLADLLRGGCAETLVRACWQGALAIAVVWLLCRAWPRMPAGARSWLWRLAFLKLLVALVWMQPVTLRLLPARPAPAVVPPAMVLPGLPAHLAVVDEPLPPPRGDSRPPSPNPWQLLWLAATGWGALLWPVGAAWCGFRLLRDRRRAGRLLRASRLLADARVAEWTEELSRRFGLRRAPGLRVVDDLEGPLLVGAIRPVILLPGALLASCTEAQLRLVLAHEMAHVRRRDLLWAWLPALAQALFFFHPFVWLAQREARLAQEIACDEAAVLATGEQPAEYGQVLVRTAVSPAAASAHGWGTAGVSEPYHTLKRRLEAMKQVVRVSRRQVWMLGGAIAVLALAGLVPWRMATRAAETSAAVDERAEALYDDALGMNPANPEARAKVLAQAIERSPKEIRYRIALGDTYVGAQQDASQETAAQKAMRLQRARKVYQEAAQAVPTSAIPYSRLADLDWAADRNAAAAHLDKAMALDAENALPAYERAMLHFLAGEDEQGRKLLLGARGRKVVRYDVMMPTRPMTLPDASACVYVVAAQFMPRVSRLRDLARQALRVSEEMKKADDLAGARALLIEAQRAATRVTFAEPRLLISMLVGIAMDQIVCTKGLEPLTARMADAEGLARLAARKQARDKMRDGTREATTRITDLARNPFRVLTVLKDEGQMVQALLDEGGWTETIDEMK